MKLPFALLAVVGTGLAWAPCRAGVPLAVGSGTLAVAETGGTPSGSLCYSVDGHPVVTDVVAFAASTDWKRRLFDFSGSTVTREDTFAGRRVTWRQALPEGSVTQTALLRSASLELSWRLDLREFAGNLEINVFLPETTLGISPCEATYQDGRVEQDKLWVEQRGPLTNIRTLAITSAQHRVALDAGTRGGWQFQDLRRSQDHRGQYRMVLPLYNLKDVLRQEVSLRISADGPDPELAPLDLAGAANMGFADEQEGDRKGGWTDQGENDLRGFPTGVVYLLGIPFRVLDPGGSGRSVVMLRGKERPYFAERVGAPVGRKAGALYFVHGCAWAGAGKTALTYAIAYEDGTQVFVPVRVGLEIDDWWGVRDLSENAVVAWRGANARAPVGVMLLRWLNPHPQKAIRSVALQAGDGPVAGVIAITAASRALPLHTGSETRGSLPRLAIAGAGKVLIDEIMRGTRLDPAYRAADLKTDDLSRHDLLVVTEDLPASVAERVLARVREGGRLLVFGPPPAGLSAALPVASTPAPVLRVPAPYWRWNQGEPRAFLLQAADPQHPVFSGLDLAQIPPTGAFYQVQVPPSAQVLAWWVSKDGERFPALVEGAYGSGQVVFLNIDRLYPASGGTDTMRIFLDSNRYRDPLFLKLAYHTAGRDDVARRIGDVFRAKALRETLQSPLYDLHGRLENAHAVAGYVGTAHAGRAVEGLRRALEAVAGAIDAGDNSLEGLMPEGALAAYAQAKALLDAAGPRFAAAEKQFRAEARGRGLGPARVAAGPKLLVGPTHVMHGLFYPKGPSRKWLHDQTLGQMRRELGWNVFDVMAGVYGAGELRPDGRTLQPDALDDIALSAQEHGMRLVVCTAGGAFGTGAGDNLFTEAGLEQRASVLRELGRHFDRLPAFYAFEPNNEPGLGVEPKTAFGYNPQTISQFHAWLLARHRSLERLNRSLGTRFAGIEAASPPPVEQMAQVGSPDPRRALWAEWIEFRFRLMERLHRSDYEALRSVSRKPIFDRTAGDGMNWCGVAGSGALAASRQERRALWHDALGSHVISPFLLDYQAGMGRGKRLVQSEYYWSTYGGSSDGLRYRFGGNFMHPYLENDRRNFAAVGRNFWKAVSRGNDLFTIYHAIPTGTYGYDEGYFGPHCAYWADASFKGMTYAMKVYPREVNRIRGELLGARHEAQLGILEPLASIVHTFGTCIGEDIRDLQYEAENLHRDMLAGHVQTDIVGEWSLLARRQPHDTPGPPNPKSQIRNPKSEVPPLPPVLLVPYGVYLDNAVQQKLIAWVRAGGLLFATGPVGLYDRLGHRSGRLLQAAFPGVKVERGDGLPAKLSLPGAPGARRRWTFAHPSVTARYEGGSGAVLSARLGKGRVVVTGFPYTDAPQATRSLLHPVGMQVAPPAVDADNASVQLYVAKRGGTRVVYCFNEDHAREQRVTLSLRAPHRLTDLRAGLGLGVRKSLRLTLLPGECRVLRATPAREGRASP